MKNIFAYLLVAVLAAAVAAGIVKSSFVTEKSDAVTVKESIYDRVIRTGTIRCGYSAWKPLMWVEPNTNEKKGIFPDMMEEIGKRLNLKVIWQEELGWGTVVEAVKSGRVDMACSGYWLQQNRYKFVASSTPLLYTPTYVWARDDETRFKTLEDLNSDQVTVGMGDGDAVNPVVTRRFPKAKIFSMSELSTNGDMIESLTTKKIDFLAYDATSFAEYVANNPHKIKNLFPDQPLSIFPVVMLLPPDDPHFKQMIDDAMKNLDYDGTLDIILKNNHMEDAYLRNLKPSKTSP